uniref:Uncharacterized protein n=1 Tax=Arundo donax TaxID=35708 RepID=A0A0A9D9M7_ARUDO
MDILLRRKKTFTSNLLKCRKRLHLHALERGKNSSMRYFLHILAQYAYINMR